MSAPVLCTAAAIAGTVTHMALFVDGEWERHSPGIAMAYPFIYFLLVLVLAVVKHLPFYESVILSFYASASYILGLFASITVYRLYLHPLRAYPGPLGAKCTAFWSARISAARYKFHKEVERLHLTHGDVVRIRKFCPRSY